MGTPGSLNAGTLVPYKLRPYFVRMFRYVGLKHRPYIVDSSNKSVPEMAIDYTLRYLLADILNNQFYGPLANMFSSRYIHGFESGMGSSHV